MQFLVYLTILMVAISTVLIEVHWLAAPEPQPKPARSDDRARPGSEDRRFQRGSQDGLFKKP